MSGQPTMQQFTFSAQDPPREHLAHSAGALGCSALRRGYSHGTKRKTEVPRSSAEPGADGTSTYSLRLPVWSRVCAQRTVTPPGRGPILEARAVTSTGPACRPADLRMTLPMSDVKVSRPLSRQASVPSPFPSPTLDSVLRQGTLSAP